MAENQNRDARIELISPSTGIRVIGAVPFFELAQQYARH
jgi:hypothetical protein